MDLIDLDVARTLGEALAIGVLIGTERYRGRDPGEHSPAGVRTFTTIALLGGIVAVIDSIAVAAVTFAGVATLVAIGYYRGSDEHIGSTTETAALLIFWLGYLTREHEAAAIGTAIVLAILLYSKRPMHDFVKGKISDTEFFDTLKFLAVVFVVYPLLPDEQFGPYGFFNPRQAWTFVVIYSALGYAGYVLMRMFGAGRGLFVSAIMGGLVSTPAVTVSLAGYGKKAPDRPRLIAAAAVMANAMQFPRLLILVLIVNRDLAGFVAPLLLSMLAIGMVGAFIVGKVGRDGAADPSLEVPLRNPFSFLPALSFAAFLVGFLFFSRLALSYAGQGGVYLVGLLTGLATVSAVALSLPSLVAAAGLTASGAATVLLLAIAANAAVKWILALVNGTRPLALWLGAGMLTMLGMGAIYLLLTAA